MKHEEKAAVLRAAARDLDEGKSPSTSTAIWWVTDGDKLRDACNLNGHFEQLFTPHKYETRYYWNGDWGDNARECGVLALLLAAAMAETGDL